MEHAEWKDKAFECIERGSVADLMSALTQSGLLKDTEPKVDKHIREMLEHLHRVKLQQCLKGKNNFEGLNAVLCMVFDAGKEEILRPQAPFALIQDVFEALPIRACREWFNFIETNTEKLRGFMALGVKVGVAKSVNATAIRAFCSLLKRLSRNSDAPFCGRILLTLAQLMPLVDPSGVNKTGLINRSNVTHFSTAHEGDMEVEGPKGEAVDYQFHNKFWTLVQFLQDPQSSIKNEDAWNKMTECAKDVLSALTSTKKEVAGTRDLKTESMCYMESCSNISENYFPKFLTSTQLIKFEMCDPHFRKHVLIQFLIFLKALERSSTKRTEYTLTNTKKAWVADKYKIVSELLDDPTGGEKQSAKAIFTMIEREENWVTWKREGCASFEKFTQEVDSAPEEGEAIDIETELQEVEVKGFDMGDKTLNELWNMADMTRSSSKIPTLERILEPAIEELQAPPEFRVPREETIFKDDMFEWRAYRAICRDDYSLLGALRPLKKKKGENTPDSAIDGGVSDDQTLLEKALYRKHVLKQDLEAEAESRKRKRADSDIGIKTEAEEAKESQKKEEGPLKKVARSISSSRDKK